jgi:protein phosphatase-4 regulatory subunit 3
MNVIIDQMSADKDPELGTAVQLSNVLRLLLDPEKMVTSVNKSEKTDFLNYFYKNCMHSLIGGRIFNV